MAVGFCWYEGPIGHYESFFKPIPGANEVLAKGELSTRCNAPDLHSFTFNVTLSRMKRRTANPKRPRMSSSKKIKKSKGTVMAEETRAKTNGLTDTERDALMSRAMQLIYRQGEGEACAVRR